MPELPEVETVVRGLVDAGLAGCRIVDTRIGWARTLVGLSPEDFRSRIVGRRVRAIRRRAKYIVMQLDPSDYLLIHLRMTGSLTVRGAGEVSDPYERVALVLGDGRELRFRDTRKFGRWYLVPDAELLLRRMGPEPLDRAFTVEVLVHGLQRHKRMLKPLLLDQAFLAGLGNIYVDEALWEARLHPCCSSQHLKPEEVKRLHGAIQLVLQRGIASMGTTLGSGAVNFYSVAGRKGRNQDALRVFRRHGLACPSCGNEIVRILVGQRSTHLCPHCQRLPRRRRVKEGGEG